MRHRNFVTWVCVGLLILFPMLSPVHRAAAEEKEETREISNPAVGETHCVVWCYGGKRGWKLSSHSVIPFTNHHKTDRVLTNLH